MPYQAGGAIEYVKRSAVYERIVARISEKGWSSCVSGAWQLGLTQTFDFGNCSVPHFEHLPPTSPRTISRLR